MEVFEEVFECGDRETPIEEYPGYIGTYFDYDFFGAPEAALKPLETFDFQKYRELVEQHGDERELKLDLASGTHNIAIDDDVDVVTLLDKLPTVTVYLDNGPPDAGPASGPIHLFFVADGVSEAELDASINALAQALKSDLASLESSIQ